MLVLVKVFSHTVNSYLDIGTIKRFGNYPNLRIPIISSSYIVGQELAHITDGQTKAEGLNVCDTDIWSNVLGKNTSWADYLVGLTVLIDPFIV